MVGDLFSSAAAGMTAGGAEARRQQRLLSLPKVLPLEMFQKLSALAENKEAAAIRSED
jgi:hypothetical protein